jgi:hypothetical protein
MVLNSDKKDDDAIVRRAPARVTTWLFYIGLAIDTSLLLMMCSNAFLTPGGFTGATFPTDPTAGLTDYGRFMLWASPLALVALMGVAWLLKAVGATIVAVVLLWVPALPFAIALVVGLGLAILFILFGGR